MRLVLLPLLLLLAAQFLGAQPLYAQPPSAQPLRLGLLAFGTAQWEVETMRARGLDRRHGIGVEIHELAGKDSASVALLGGAVDAIIGDWPWVARQRALGHDLTFIPWVGMTGALLVPPHSPIKSLADLAGKRLGIAGGPLDKSWLLLRALAVRHHGIDLDKSAHKVFGAPALLVSQLEAGRLDALLTFWPSAVPLEARGYGRLVDVASIPAQLGLPARMPMVGWIVHRGWAAAHRAELDGLRRAETETRTLMCGPGFDWTALDRLTRAGDAATREGLRAGFCAGGLADWGAEERLAAERLFTLLAELGGEDLVGPARAVPAGTFWP